MFHMGNIPAQKFLRPIGHGTLVWQAKVSEIIEFLESLITMKPNRPLKWAANKGAAVQLTIQALSRHVALAQLVDEYGPGLYTRVARRVMRLWEQLIFHITKVCCLEFVSWLLVNVIIDYS